MPQSVSSTCDELKGAGLLDYCLALAGHAFGLDQEAGFVQAVARDCHAAMLTCRGPTGKVALLLLLLELAAATAAVPPPVVCCTCPVLAGWFEAAGRKLCAALMCWNTACGRCSTHQVSGALRGWSNVRAEQAVHLLSTRPLVVGSEGPVLHKVRAACCARSLGGS